jgi:hypothetical protein
LSKEEEEEEEEHRKFSDWLASRMVDANLSAEDRKIFTDWLMKESPDGENHRGAHSHAGCEKKNEVESGLKITLHDVRELFTWLKTRITTSDINDGERKLFNEWLVQKVTDHQTEDHVEYHKLKRELLD